MTEVVSGEQAAPQSPEQRLIGELTATALDVLDGHGVVPVIADNGVETREFPAYPSQVKLTETQDPEGVRYFEYTVPKAYVAPATEGLETARWREGSSTLVFEIELKDGRRVSGPARNPGAVKQTAASLAVRFSRPEKPAPAPKAPSRLKAFLGRLPFGRAKA